MSVRTSRRLREILGVGIDTDEWFPAPYSFLDPILQHSITPIRKALDPLLYDVTIGLNVL